MGAERCIRDSTGTDPLNPNTDDDLVKDGQEVSDGSDPNDSTAPPVDPNKYLVGHWTFEGETELEDLTGNFPELLLQEDAEIVDGKLDVGGNSQTADAWAITDSDAGEYIGPTIRNKTLVSWVLMQKIGPRVRAGSVITIDSVQGDTFDGIVTPETDPPYAEEDAARFEIDYGILEQNLGFFAGCDILIADPGAEIDLLAMIGRFDLIREYLDSLRQRFDTVITSVHHAGVTLPLLEAENIPVDGYLTTVNAPGTFMFPTRDMAIDAIKNATKPVIAIKPMAGGRYLGHKAFEYVFDEVGVQASMFGMGTVDQVRETTQAAREVLGAA